MKHTSLTCISLLASLLLAVPHSLRAQEAPPPAAAEAPAVAADEAAHTPEAPQTTAAVRVIDAADTAEPVVSMEFDESPLVDVIKAFRDATGANIISGGTNLQATISVRLDNVPWRKGLTSILEPQGLQLIEQPAGSGIYVITTKTVAVPKFTQTFELSYAKADDVANLLKSTLDKTGLATPFPSANVVIVTATEQQLAECEKILKTIDKPRPQVYIEARFVELSAAASKQLGLNWEALNAVKVTSSFSGGMALNQSQAAEYPITGGSLVPSQLEDSPKAGTTAADMAWKKTRTVGGQISLAEFNMVMSAFEKLDGASVFSNPRIIVANEETANIDMTTKEPNVSVKSSRSGTSGDQLDITTELALIPGKTEPFVGEAFFSYGISLKVTPRISPSGLITVKIEPSISEKDLTQGDSDSKGYYAIKGSANTPTTKYPIIKVRRMETVFTMQNATTAVIGGLTRTTESKVTSGIPFLRELPWIGPRLFGWKSRGTGQNEIVIFVSVGIADPIDMEEKIGLPKNAILSRELFTGTLKEPGDRTIEELLSLDDPAPKKSEDK